MASSDKPRVLILVDWYLPGYQAGGPVQSVAAIVEHLSDEFDFYILTSDRDFGSEAPYPGIPTNQWLDRHRCKVNYLSPDASVNKALKEALSQFNPQVVYFNSLFSMRFTLKPLMALRGNKQIKKVLAPRGMLGAGALAIKSGKKKVFLRVARLMGLYKGLTWHASSSLEKQEVEAVFGASARVKVALNLTRLPQPDETWKRTPKQPGTVRFFFLSRISSKKNLLAGLQWLEQLPDANIRFDIIGPVEDVDHWNHCQEVIQRLKGKVTVTHHGAVEPPAIPPLLAGYHFLLLPTFHENFGHVVLESMACGCPVIISQHTPWRNLAADKAGWDLDLNAPDQFVNVLQEATQMDQTTFDAWSNGARAFADKHGNAPETLEANRNVFRAGS